MRAFCSAMRVTGRGALRCTIRWSLTVKEDEAFLEQMRVLLRRYRALPLSRITALFSDEMLDIMSNISGGLRRYFQERPSRFRLEILPSGVTVVMLAGDLRSVGPGLPIVGQALAHLAVSPQQQMTVSQLFCALPALEQRKCGNEKYLESFLLKYPSLLTVQNGMVRMAPTSFMQLRGGVPAPLPTSRARVVKLQSPVPEPPTSSNTAVEDAKMNKLMALLYGVVPFSYYVPLSFVTGHSRSYMAFSPGMPVDDVLEELQRVTATTLDCRVIGSGENDVFLRMMDAERRPYINDETRLSSSYEVLPLGAPLLEAFLTYAAKGPDHIQRLRSGIAMSDLKDILPSELLKRLHLYDSTQEDAACIFVFDRLRHLFDVNMTAYMVRPWEVLAAHAQPSSLTWQTTPIPVVLRHGLMALEKKPLSPEAFFNALPSTSRKQLKCAYASVADFAAHHSLYLFLKDGLIWTPYLAAVSQGARVPASSRNASSGRHLTDAAKAKMMMELLPLHHPVDWSRFCTQPSVRDLPFEAGNMRQEFFERHKECFRVYEPLGTTALIVGRRDGIPPPAKLLRPPCNSLGDLVRQVALLSIDGAQEGNILNQLSKEARLMVKRYGTLEDIARQLPMWFDVRNEMRDPGNALISYIATDQSWPPCEKQKTADE
ncbi:hypothetical protein TcG_06412 [Trypanosoma cruzi]|uniref:DUF7883 domain-containing protein n=1 Tax=Trypanosoma cruzi Dm28c TaxID=1416333 RepID=V5BB53_TRYCR|nr:hypothetical protein TCDM_06827 [Trypanosoma cruzi Dm28c]KAF8280612.1 hypothetical protein TcBrA4_0092990 [Trypanosoma cruzi]PBJ71144.1 hypothetical protein BCY84_17482 [Trypanosoma cruzi cruzi]RNF16655.1 hypothetical protein TcG_06412 [Trypanosoma cruzi]